MPEHTKFLIPEQFGVTQERGFLPKEDPEISLPHDAFDELTELGREMPNLLGSGTLRQRVQKLYPLNYPYPAKPLTQRQKILLMVHLGFTISAYTHANAHLAFTPKHIREQNPREDEVIIPKNIAVPFVEVAKELGVPPILSYSFYCLNNWWRFNLKGPITVDNLQLLQHFLGGLDERHFILIHTEIEQKLAPAIYATAPAQEAVLQDDIVQVTEQLEIMANSENNAVLTMHRMGEGCHPDIYYLRVRPYIFGFNIPGAPGRVIFDGVDTRIPMLRGETGAQTPSWPTLWAAIGIQFSDDNLKRHVLDMRNYLMPDHLAFLLAVERGPSIRQFVLDCVAQKRSGWRRLKDAYNRNITAIHRFFRLHLKFADIYINKKSNKYALYKEQGQYGTGGTRFMQYLTQHCDEIHAHKIT